MIFFFRSYPNMQFIYLALRPFMLPLPSLYFRTQAKGSPETHRPLFPPFLFYISSIPLWSHQRSIYLVSAVI